MEHSGYAGALSWRPSTQVRCRLSQAHTEHKSSEPQLKLHLHERERRTEQCRGLRGPHGNGCCFSALHEFLSLRPRRVETDAEVEPFDGVAVGSESCPWRDKGESALHRARQPKHSVTGSVR